MPPDEPTDEERQQELPQDNGTPFQPAAPSPDPSVAADPVTQASTDSTLDDTHPATDTGIQSEESYDEGISGAAEAQEPNADSAVVDAAPDAQPGQTFAPTTNDTTAMPPSETPTSDGEPDEPTDEQPSV